MVAYKLFQYAKGFFQPAGFLANTKEADFFVMRDDGNQPRGLDSEVEGVQQHQATELLASL